MREENVFLSSPLAGEDVRRTGEGYIKENTYLNPLIGFECLRTQNHFPRQGGSQTASGFTLIELLVVVLIIGILAAVAVPQYQKAVEKSRAAQAQTMLKSVSQAIESYHLANGEWPQSFDELSIDIPWTGTEKYYNYPAEIKDVRSNSEWAIELGHSGSYGSYVIIGRLNGQYAGGGFVLHDFHWPADYFPGETLCIENTGLRGVKFNKADGTYCVKLFGGNLGSSMSWFRYYHLP